MKRIAWLLLLALAGAAAWAGRLFYLRVTRPNPGFTSEVSLRVARGDSVKRIAVKLEESRVIADAFTFRLYYRIFCSRLTLQAGEYRLRPPLTMRQVIDLLHHGRVELFKLTVREGLTIAEIDRQLQHDLRFRPGAFREAAERPDLVRDIDGRAGDLEGYLFPDTYRVRLTVSAGELVDLMVARFRENFGNDWIWRARDIGMTVRQVVVLASLIEKETAERDERFLISSVFHNRLRQGMLLDCDPTIVYGLERIGRYRGKLGWDELRFDTPYNTRLHRGLPPGPICNPGQASIEAALYPETSNYFYFVAKDNRSHAFSETLAEHNRAVRKFIITRHEP